MKSLVVAAAMLGMAAQPASSQTLQALTIGAMSATDVGIEPMMRLASSLYAKLALAGEMRTIAAARAAEARAGSEGTRMMAAAMVREHEAALRDLSAIPIAKAELGHARSLAVRDIAANRNVTAAGFAEAQLEWQRHAWALHSGYAADGQVPALRSFARSAVMQSERDLRRLPMRPMQY